MMKTENVSWCGQKIENTEEGKKSLNEAAVVQNIPLNILTNRLLRFNFLFLSSQCCAHAVVRVWHKNTFGYT